ncbi:MAG: hypothetical protein QM820_64965 [Minicystis sp.]
MKKLILALALCFAAGAFQSSAQAQIPIDPDRSIGIYQNGLLVGEIMRVDGTDEQYTEHWVLYPDYVYPRADSGIVTELIPGLAEYDGLEDFFHRVPFADGSRYVRVACEDGKELPLR